MIEAHLNYKISIQLRVVSACLGFSLGLGLDLGLRLGLCA